MGNKASFVLLEVFKKGLWKTKAQKNLVVFDFVSVKLMCQSDAV